MNLGYLHLFLRHSPLLCVAFEFDSDRTVECTNERNDMRYTHLLPFSKLKASFNASTYSLLVALAPLARFDSRV